MTSFGTGNHEGKIETFEHFCYVGGGGDYCDSSRYPAIRSNINNRRTRSLLSTRPLFTPWCEHWSCLYQTSGTSSQKMTDVLIFM